MGRAVRAVRGIRKLCRKMEWKRFDGKQWVCEGVSAVFCLKEFSRMVLYGKIIVVGGG